MDELRAAFDGMSKQEIIEKQARYAARRTRKLELVRPAAADDATACDRRRIAEIDSEVLDDRQRIVGEKLAAQLVARKRVAIDERDGTSSPCEERGEGRPGGTSADDRYVH